MAQKKILGNQINLTDLNSLLTTDLVTDLTPQLGADLDTNGFNITGTDAPGGDGGYIGLYAGTGGSFNGGNVNIKGGAGLTGATGGYVNIISGDSFDGTGGYMALSAGAGTGTADGGYTTLSAGTSVNGFGGNFNVYAGDSSNSNGGAVSIYGGSAGGTGNGGNVTIDSGDSTGTSGRSGNIDIDTPQGVAAAGHISIGVGRSINSAGTYLGLSAGDAFTAGFIGGDVIVRAGNAITTSAAGHVKLIPGGGSGNTNPGAVRVHPGSLTVGQGVIQLWDFTNGSHTTGNFAALKAPAFAGSPITDVTWTLPQAQQTANDPLGIDLGEYTVATLPPAATYPNCWALATDGGSPDVRTIVRSNGTNWMVVAPEGIAVVA